MGTTIRIEGDAAAVRELRAALGEFGTQGDGSELQIGPLETVTPVRGPLGIEPLTYFIIAASAHLTAALLHDYLKLAFRPSNRPFWTRSK